MVGGKSMHDTIVGQERAGGMIARLGRAIILLPGTALILIPGMILWLTAGSEWAATPVSYRDGAFWLALLPFMPGLALAMWTGRLFVTVGEGTPAPWDPPKKLVVRGPYRHVRNPMISSVLIMLLAEAVLFRSWPILGWLILFFAMNAMYFPLSEEKGMERRFGDDYRRYKQHVPRWIPRRRPWDLR